MPKASRAERDRRRLERTAYHEAGHAVAALHHGRRFERVTIEPDGESLGHVLYEAYDRRHRKDSPSAGIPRRIVEELILVALSGLAAEGRFAGRRDWRGAGNDIAQALVLAAYLHSGDEVLGKYLDYMIARVRQAMDVPSTWARVEAVAAALLGRRTLGQAEVLEVCRGALAARVRRIPSPSSAAVEAAPEASTVGASAGAGQGGISG